MSFESALKAHLQADVAIVALVADRIWPSHRRTQTLPAIVYSRAGGEVIQDLDGEDYLQNPRVQIDVWASSYDGAAALGIAVRMRMNVAASDFRSALNSEPMEFYESETRYYRVLLDYSCWYRAAQLWDSMPGNIDDWNAVDYLIR